MNPQEILREKLQKALSSHGFTSVIGPVSHNHQDLGQEPDLKGDFLWYEAEKSGTRYSVMATDEAQELYKEGGEMNKLSLLRNQKAISDVIVDELPSTLKFKLISTLELYEIDESCACVVMDYFFDLYFLGSQRNASVDVEEVKHAFVPLAQTLVKLDGFSFESFPRNLATNEADRKKQKQARFEFFKKKFKELSLDGKLLAKLYETWLPLPILQTFQKHDLVPWWMVKLNDHDYGLLNYHWGGFREQYYDVAYMFIKLWVHTKNPTLAQKWLEVFRSELPADKKDSFEKQIFEPLTARIPQDLIEYHETSDYMGLVTDLAERIATGIFEKLIRK